MLTHRSDPAARVYRVLPNQAPNDATEVSHRAHRQCVRRARTGVRHSSRERLCRLRLYLTAQPSSVSLSTSEPAYHPIRVLVFVRYLWRILNVEIITALF